MLSPAYMKGCSLAVKVETLRGLSGKGKVIFEAGVYDFHAHIEDLQRFGNSRRGDCSLHRRLIKTE